MSNPLCQNRADMNLPLAIEQLRNVLRRQHKAIATEASYVYWLRHYVKGPVLTLCTFTFHRAFFRAAASRFETLLQLPMTRRSATHFKVIVVSRVFKYPVPGPSTTSDS